MASRHGARISRVALLRHADLILVGPNYCSRPPRPPGGPRWSRWALLLLLGPLRGLKASRRRPTHRRPSQPSESVQSKAPDRGLGAGSVQGGTLAFPRHGGPAPPGAGLPGEPLGRSCVVLVIYAYPLMDSAIVEVRCLGASGAVRHLHHRGQVPAHGGVGPNFLLRAAQAELELLCAGRGGGLGAVPIGPGCGGTDRLNYMLQQPPRAD
jgi:hypothetical protein